MVFCFIKQQSLTGFQAIWPKWIKPATILWVRPNDQVYLWTPYENIGSVDKGGSSYEARYDCCGTFMIVALGRGDEYLAQPLPIGNNMTLLGDLYQSFKGIVSRPWSGQHR